MVLFEDTSSTTKIYIELKEDADGSLTIAGHDVGEAPRMTFGASDYEHAVTVPADAVRALAFHLLAEKFEGDARAVSKLKDFCEQQAIPCSFWAWP